MTCRWGVQVGIAHFVRGCLLGSAQLHPSHAVPSVLVAVVLPQTWVCEGRTGCQFGWGDVGRQSVRTQSLLSCGIKVLGPRAPSIHSLKNSRALCHACAHVYTRHVHASMRLPYRACSLGSPPRRFVSPLPRWDLGSFAAPPLPPPRRLGRWLGGRVCMTLVVFGGPNAVVGLAK